MTYDEALAYLHSLVDFEKLGAVYFGRDRFQLASTRRLLSDLGEPQAGLPIVHLAGTKGKGSTAAMLEAILRAHGFRVGLFTQPHLVDIRERTRVGGRRVEREELARLVARVRPFVEAMNGDPNQEPITFYEAHLAVSLLHFAEQRVDFAVLETGLGGRLDATNALQPVACGITRIDYDHTEILGDRLADIAREKAGILKPGVPCVFAPQAPEVAAILAQQAAAVGAPVAACPTIEMEEERGAFTVVGGQRYAGLRLPLAGRHQQENAAVAIGLAEALGGLQLSAEAVREGLAALRWPGRFHVVPGEPTIVLDVAHNRVSAGALRENLEALLGERPPGSALVLVVGMARDKDLAGFAAALFPLAAHVICTQAASPRAASRDALAQAGRSWAGGVECVGEVGEALERARERAGRDGVVCVTGSFHVVGEAMKKLGIEP